MIFTELGLALRVEARFDAYSSGNNYRRSDR